MNFVPRGTRDPGDAWVTGPDGSRYWGRFGAAGLLIHDPRKGVLLQHRAEWSHHGGTWGIAGGALAANETTLDGAIREAHEEAGVPFTSVVPRFSAVWDLGFWSYSTIVAGVSEPFDAVVTDAESLAVEWVPVDAVGERPLHPGFAASWSVLHRELDSRTVVVVDGLAVLGEHANARDERAVDQFRSFMEQLQTLSAAGLATKELVPGGDGFSTALWPEYVVVIPDEIAGNPLGEYRSVAGTAIRMVPALREVSDTVSEIAEGIANAKTRVVVAGAAHHGDAADGAIAPIRLAELARQAFVLAKE